MAKKKAPQKKVCSPKVGKVIDKARQFEEKDDLEDYVTGAAVHAVQGWAIKHKVIINEDEALYAFLALFNCDKSDVFIGEEEVEVLTAAAWKKRVAEVNKKYPDPAE